MGILKNIGEVFKQTFLDNEFAKSFKDAYKPPKNYQKEIAENTRKILEAQKKMEKDLSK